jgi:hypothetical protein
MKRRVLAALLSGIALIAVSALSSGVPAEATAAGSNGLIAVNRGGEIYTVGKTGHLVQLTRSHGMSSHPKWSPDGKHIAYDRPGGPYGEPYIWLMRADGSDNHKLWKGTAPSWSPSGTRLAYVVEKLIPSTDPNPGCVFHELATRAVVGGAERIIDENGEVSCTSSTGIRFDYGPATSWSRDQTLVYVGVVQYQLSPVQPDPNHPVFDQLVAVVGAHSAGTDVGPNPTTMLSVLNHSVGSIRNAPLPKVVPTPDAAPGRNTVLYTTPLDSQMGLHKERLIIEAEDSSTAREASVARFASYPVFSPDGTKVLFVQHKTGAAPDVRRLNLRTGRITTVLAHATQPDWQPIP